MQVIIPLAGKGTRLRPHTHLVPKPLLKVAGRPVMDWVMDRLDGLDVEELIFITGHLKEQVEQYARSRYATPSRFIEQRVQDGTAGAVNLARPLVHGPAMIIFVDTVFEADLTLVNRTDADGVIWAKEVDDYQRFGVVVTDDQGYMTRIVEKPSEPISKLANIGLYWIRDVEALWAGIDHTLAQPTHKGEYFLTDAFQHMIERGRRILTAEVGGWYDCGQLGTTLETNGILLAKGAARHPALGADVTLIEPVLVQDGCTVERSTLGPNVTLESGTVVRDARVINAIVGEHCRIEQSTLRDAMLGDRVTVRHFEGSGSIGSDSDLTGDHVTLLDELLGSYLDLARHLDPLRHPHDAPAEVHSRLGRFDLPWLTAQMAALKSIAGAIEDIEEVASLDDEVDRTMLINTVRLELVQLTQATTASTGDPGVPLRHAQAALDAVLGEDFTAAHEVALRARLEELPGFLATLREDSRPAPRFLVDGAMRTLSELAERLDAASERLDGEPLAAVRDALVLHHEWLAQPVRLGGEAGLGEDAVESRLHLVSNDPVGVKGTLRLLELRRTGVERALVHAAEELGYGEDWRSAVDALPEIAELDPMERLDAWEEEWHRVGTELALLGLPSTDLAPPPAPPATDRATLGAWALRARSAALLEAGRAATPRNVRRLLVAPGLRRGFNRTVAALLRDTALFSAPEQLLATADLALRDAVAAETDLLLQARLASPEELLNRVSGLTGLGGDEARDLVTAVAEDPFEALAAGLANEGWQGWFAEEGGDPAGFLVRATLFGGLAVPLARWAARGD